MLFMGSVFTSCIPQTEPEGVREMRFAHAEYLRELADLVKANQAIAAAEAAFKNAQAAVKQAAAREKTADAVAKEIENAIAQADADQQIANILDNMEKDRLDNEAALIASKIALAQAQKNLEDALNAIEIERLGLSEEEVDALTTIHDIYMYWMGQLYSYLDSYKDLDNDLRDWLLDAYKDEALDEAEMEYLLQKYNKQIELKENELKYKE
jgi:hypothetical protein